jgi:hypothetical protein
VTENIKDALDLINKDGIYECVEAINDYSGRMMDNLDTEPFPLRSFVLNAHVIVAAVKTMLKIMVEKP